MVTGTAQLASAHWKVCLPLEHAGRVILFSFLPEPDDIRTWAGLFSCASVRNALGQLVPAKIFCLHLWRESGGAGVRNRGELDALGMLAFGGFKD